MERLDKLLSSQGFGSRRDVVRLIRQGRVTVDKTIIRTPDAKVDPAMHCVELDGQAVQYKKHLYLMMNKPAGFLSASRDSKQPTVIDLLPAPLTRRGLFPAGRLDKDTEGLLVITDDGDLAHRMLSPKKEIYKVYEAILDGPITEEDSAAFKNGIVLEDGTKCRPAKLYIPAGRPENLVHIIICEGKYHQVKRMMAQIGRDVSHLSRIKIGGLPLDPGLDLGQCREMNPGEVARIFSSPAPVNPSA